MPGVPPDALNQVKRGLRGLFNRKKRSQGDAQPTSTTPQQQQQQPTETKNTSQNPTITTTAPSPSPAQTANERNVGNERTKDGFPPPPPGPPPGNNGISPPLPQTAAQIPSPSGIEEAKDINLDPTTSASTKPTTTTPATTPTASTPTASAAQASTENDIESPTETFRTAGSVATSPTLDSAKKINVDHNGMSATSGPLDDAIMFGEGRGSADADGRQFLEKERDLEDDRPKGEVILEEEGEKAEGAKAAA